MWLDKVSAIFKDRGLRKKALFVFSMMAIFRVLASVPIPGVDAERLARFFEANQFFGLMNVFTGGALERMSIVMLGLGPYITAIIILQLLTLVWPRLKEMYQEEGEKGRQRFTQYARILTVPLALIQALGMLTLLRNQNILPTLSSIEILVSALSVTGGAILLMWLGELISERGIGNGISLLIFAGIIADTPASVRQTILNWEPALLPNLIFFVLMALIIIVAVVIVNEARRNVPVSYAKRVRGRKMYGGVRTYLPMMINPAGVIPIIFALSLMMIPGMMGNVFANAQNPWLSGFANFLKGFSENLWIHIPFYFFLVVAFTYFYTAVTFDPKNVAENIQKMGGFVPGIRPGKETVGFLKKILNRVLLVGAVFLGLIAIMPTIVQGLTQIQAFQFAIGGTAVLIVVSVVLETTKRVEAQLEMKEYE